jgi:autotransporter-associated beta strand protein
MSGYGRLEIGNLDSTTAANALGQSGPAASNLVINGILAYTGTASAPTTVATDRGFTLKGTTDPYNAGAINYIEVQDADVNLKFNGQVTTSYDSMFNKTGPGTLTFAGAGANTLASCDIQITDGALVLENGTFSKDHANVAFQWGWGEMYVGTVAGQAASFVLQNGAMLNLNGGAEAIAGQGAGTVGSITLNDTAKIVSSSHYRIGNGGVGTLTLNGSSRVTNYDHQIVIGLGTSSTGTVTINGDGTSATNYPVFESLGAYENCYSWVGPGTTGEISVTNGTYTESGIIYVGVSAGGIGTLTLNTTAGSLAPATVNAATIAVGGQYNGSGGGGAGTLSMNSGSQLGVSGSLYFGQFGNGTGTIGGATGPSATVSVGSHLYVGYTGTSQGDLTVEPTGHVGVNQWFIVGYSEAVEDLGATGVVNNYGTIVKNANDYSFTIIGRAGDSTFNQNAGSFTDGTITCLGQWGNTGTINLNGGVFSTITIQAGYWNDSTAHGIITFDGGTLKVNADSQYLPGVGDSATLISPYEGTMDVIVKENGAIIDTSGINANILVPLVEDSVSTGGGLTKIGAGALTLVDGNTYTGNTTVNEGTLNVPNLNTPNATVYVATGAAFNATSIVADTLTIGGDPLPLAGAATAAVPEPGTLALLALAGLGLLLAAWRRK